MLVPDTNLAPMTTPNHHVPRSSFLLHGAVSTLTDGAKILHKTHLCRGVPWLLCTPGNGSMSRHRTITSTCLSPMSGFQSRFRTFTQISPGLETLGWKIFVRKKPAHQKTKRTVCRVPDSWLFGLPFNLLSGMLRSRNAKSQRTLRLQQCQRLKLARLPTFWGNVGEI